VCRAVKSVSVKFAKVDPAAPLIVVPAKVNGLGRLRFLLDTGASHTCVTPQLVKKLGITTRGKATALGAGGEMILEIAGIESLSVAGAEVRRLTVAVVNVDHVAKLTKRIDGVVGNDFLRRFVVTIDYRRGRVTFSPPGVGGRA
jgi:hypothetical protein